MRAKNTNIYRSRIFRRHSFDLRIKLYIPGRHRPELIYGRSRDLSYGGAGLLLTREVADGTPAVLVFQLAENEVQLPGIVTHRKGFRCGIRFVRLSPEQKYLVQHICRALPA